jgi:hypothetical protein
MVSSSAVLHTDIPFRLDRLPLSRFHLLVVSDLGITWILDGLEVTIVGSLGPALQSAETLHLSSANFGAVASFYVVNGSPRVWLGHGQVWTSPHLLPDADRLPHRRVTDCICSGFFGVSLSFGWSPVLASAANMGQSTPRSMNSFRQNIADESTSSSTAVFGWALLAARWRRPFCSISVYFPATSAGGLASELGRRSDFQSYC